MRNSSFAAKQARHAAERLLASGEASDDAARVALAMRWALGRDPTGAESAAALALIAEVQKSADEKKQESKDDSAKSVDAWSAWFLTLFSTAEFRYLVDVAR